MRISSKHVGQVVAEISAGAGNPQHVATIVGEFMRRQPMVGHYVTSQVKDLAAEGVVLTLLHAFVLSRCCEVAAGRKLPVLSAPDLDRAARVEDARAALEREEPELAGYLLGNVTAEDPTLGGARLPVALGSLFLLGFAFLEQV